MRVLLTRTREDSEALASDLFRHGIETIVAPMLTIEETGADPGDLSDLQAVLVTSRNGAEAFANVTSTRDLNLYAVGGATADRLRGLGFRRVEEAGGDVHALTDLALRRLDPAGGPVLLYGAEVLAGDVEGRLRARGFAVRRVVAYRAVPAAAIAGEATAALEAGSLDGVLFFSPRTARIFVELATAAGLANGCRRAAAYCLSANVAEAARGVPWREIRIAARPDKQAMLELVRADAGEKNG